MLSTPTPILIVDDRPDGLLAIEAVLKNQGHLILRASSGKEALDLIPQYDFAVILLDVQMPDLDGFETAKLIKDQERGRHVPIIFITAINKETDHVNRGYHSGAVDYIFKPFHPDILRSKVATFVDLHRLRQRVEEQASLLLESERREREYRLAQLQIKNLQRYRNLADAIPHIVLKAKADGTMEYLNYYWCQYTGLTESQSLGDGWNASFHPEDFPVFREKWMLSRAMSDDFKIECRICSRSGQNRWHLLCFTPEREADGEIASWIGTGTDIHDLKEAQEKLSMTNDWLEARVKERTEELCATNESLKKAQREIVDISEKERSRLGQDLHDGLAQELTGACFMIQSIKNNFGRVTTAKAEKVIDAAFQLLKNALENCRRLAKTFYPVELERYGLAMALRELTLSTSSIFETECEFYLEGPETVEENQNVETQLYRIVQEGVQNAVRHSQAKHIHVIMTNQEERLILQVRDDGAGLQETQMTQGMGFRIMRHRAQLIGADLFIESEPGKGTSIRCVWPRYETSPSEAPFSVRVSAPQTSAP